MAVPQLEAQGTLGAAATEGRQASPLLVRGARPLRAVNSRIASRSDNGRLLFPAQETDQIFHGTRDRGQEEAAGTAGFGSQSQSQEAVTQLTSQVDQVLKRLQDLEIKIFINFLNQ